MLLIQRFPNCRTPATGSVVMSGSVSEEEYHSAEETEDGGPPATAEAGETDDLSSHMQRTRLDEEGGDGSEDGSTEKVEEEKLAESTAETKEEIQLTEEEIAERKEEGGRLKESGNESFKRGEYAEAVKCYTRALERYAGTGTSCAHEVAVCYANRAACFMKLEEYEKVIEDTSKALELKEDYLKAYVRRAQAREAFEKYEEALEDYKKVLELDPAQPAARQALMYLPDKIKEQQEKLKEEMFGKLKELGNAVLNPFGLSTDNFQFQQDPNTGGYSINFKR